MYCWRLWWSWKIFWNPCAFIVILQFMIILSSYFIRVFLLVFCLSINIVLGWKGCFDVLICCWFGYIVLILQWEHMVVEIIAVCSVLVAVDMVLWWSSECWHGGLGSNVGCWLLNLGVWGLGMYGLLVKSAVVEHWWSWKGWFSAVIECWWSWNGWLLCLV